MKRLEREYSEPRLEAEPPTEQHAWIHVEDPVAHCLEGKSLLLSAMPGTGKTHLAKRIVTQLSELGEGVVLISKTHCSVQNLGLGAQTADRWVRLLPGLAGRGGGHAARRRAVGRHRRALHEPPGEISQDLVHVAGEP